MIILQDQKVEVCEPKAVAKLLRDWLSYQDPFDQRKEHFFLILLDTRSKAIQVDVCSVGTLNVSLVHPREVFVRAIAESAAQIIIAHNHPSGICDPSDADITITNRLREAGKVIGIELLDHVIFTLESKPLTYYSFSGARLI